MSVQTQLELLLQKDYRGNMNKKDIHNQKRIKQSPKIGFWKTFLLKYYATHAHTHTTRIFKSICIKIFKKIADQGLLLT